MTKAWMALLGSGEFEPWTEPVDRWLLERATGDGSVLILPTASAPEGDKVFDMWAEMGLTHYGRLGIPAEVATLKTRADAEGAELVARLNDASMVFFSGGNPAYLAQLLNGSAFWTAVVEAMDRGLAYAGCSAGIAALGEMAPDNTVRGPFRRDLWRPGLRLFPKVYVGPHWDALDRFIPGLRDFIVASVPTDCRLLAIDERTAMVGDGATWTVMGSSAAHLLDKGKWTDVPSGGALEASLLDVEPRDLLAGGILAQGLGTDSPHKSPQR
jgi:cyanophycinase